MGSFFIYFLFINTMMKESNAMSVLHTFSIKLADVSIKNNTSYVLITSPPFPLSKGGNFFAFGEKRSRPPAPLLLLFCKRARSARLFGCKRPHDGSLSLPTFCGFSHSGNHDIRFVSCVYTIFVLFFPFFPQFFPKAEKSLIGTDGRFLSIFRRLLQKIQILCGFVGVQG